MHRIGFMQGRLSPQVDGKIQAFPWEQWETEFPAAQRLSLPLMEWTLDQERLYENPLLRAEGRGRIRELSARHGVAVQSLTGDCFMQAPFYKAGSGAHRSALLEDLRAILEACGDLGISFVVFPLVDKGRLESDAQRRDLVTGLSAVTPLLRELKLRIVFESDFTPSALAEFIGDLPADCFGINYDIGNSASLGYDAREEIPLLGPRILNVHIKDRVRGGTTVPLGTGGADFESVFEELAAAKYRGDFILQTARAADGDHAKALGSYRDMARQWLAKYGS